VGVGGQIRQYRLGSGEGASAQCLDRRIDSIEQLTAETTAWEQQRNAAGARIKWMFTTKKARAKMGRAYPKAQANSG
jgi:hypothetical protein